MRTVLKGLMIVLALASLPAAVQARDLPEEEVLGGFLAGRYQAVGKRLDSQDSYVGTVTLTSRGKTLAVTRMIDGVTTTGEAKIETAGEGQHVLRLRFVERGVAYEGTYLWQSDLDNYARLSGYLYRPGQATDSPGLEALFIVQD